MSGPSDTAHATVKNARPALMAPQPMASVSAPLNRKTAIGKPMRGPTECRPRVAAEMNCLLGAWRRKRRKLRVRRRVLCGGIGALVRIGDGVRGCAVRDGGDVVAGAYCRIGGFVDTWEVGVLFHVGISECCSWEFCGFEHTRRVGVAAASVPTVETRF
ncbi:uncharacterized protein K452DRAFT_52585 [Aplosporella prunicola CBS 121167]|uniref:Uncharacterized protein n=1 Tax=Aplosporella prunicola CBS 121167 TaxID=1176127 RepID=A0A6A6BA03_9PEZI|nr:uncharacterized protein K452DRAFT_52585 [Aplosporella prunicola CBS 121167]KAF2140193.1 hypothetical protein K452DRAFT_52585 [Aplosporella prunicola CBS 121167]